MCRCPFCRSRFNTPIDCDQHRRCCPVPYVDGYVIVKVNDWGREPVKVKRGIVEEGRMISFVGSDGKRKTGKVKSILRKEVVFIETKEVI